MAGRVIVIAGAKGGVGKTTTSVNLAAVLADRGRSVVIVELDLAMANLADTVGMDLEPGSTTLHEVLAGDARLIDAIRESGAGFDVLPSGLELETYVTADMRQVDRIVETLRERYDVVLLDTMAGLSKATILPLEIADGVVLVSTPYRAAVRDTSKTKQLADEVGTPVVGVVLTKIGSVPGPTPERIADHLGATLLGAIPEDVDVPSSQAQGAPVTDFAPDSEATAAYREAGARLGERLATLPERESGDLRYATDELTGVDELIDPIPDDAFLWGETAEDPDGSVTGGMTPEPDTTDPEEPAGGEEPTPEGGRADDEDDATGDATADREDAKEEEGPDHEPRSFRTRLLQALGRRKE